MSPSTRKRSNLNDFFQKEFKDLSEKFEPEIQPSTSLQRFFDPRKEPMEKKEPKSQAKIRIPVPYRHWKILARRARNTKEFSAYLIRNRGIWRLGQTQEGQKTIFHRNDPLKRPLPWSKKGLSFLFLSQPTLTERQRLILFETLHNFKFLPRGRQRSLLEFLTQPTMDVAHPRAIVKPRKKEKHRSILDFIQPMEET